MPVIIDTFNVLHQTGVLPPNLAGVDVAGLIDLISRSRFRQSRVRLVCDGASKLVDDHADFGLVAIEFSGHGRTADDVIARHIDRSTAPRRLIIVSSDREVQKAARRRRCVVLSSAQFLSQLANDIDRAERAAQLEQPQRPKQFLKPLSERDTAKWMREFGVNESDPPFTPDQLEELEEAVDALLEGASDLEAIEEKEEEEGPALSRDEVRIARAKARDLAELQGGHAEHEGTSLPAQLIAEAERLWKQQRHHPRPH